MKRYFLSTGGTEPALRIEERLMPAHYVDTPEAVGVTFGQQTLIPEHVYFQATQSGVDLKWSEPVAAAVAAVLEESRDLKKRLKAAQKALAVPE